MSDKQGFEVDFLAVGEGQRNGDAIAIRFGTAGNYKVLVYDGGTKDSGALLVKHIKEHYGTNRVDFVVNSHPDQDHASGLSVVLEELEVGELWMHQPWKYSSEIRDYFHDGRITDDSLAERLKEKMSAAYDLEKLANKKGIPILEPFAGELIGEHFRILSPDRNWYVHDLVPDFAKSPELKKVTMESRGTFGGMVKAIYDSALDWIDASFDLETLREDVTTSAENESSIVLYAQIAGKAILLTGDAGVQALHRAADNAESLNINLPNTITLTQVPHHGSRNNVSTSAMNRVFGLPSKNDSAERRSAIASVGKTCETHPRKVVTNAFNRRGFNVAKTNGASIRHHYNMPQRDSWNGKVEYIPFSAKEEKW